MLLLRQNRSLASLSRWSARDLCGQCDAPGAPPAHPELDYSQRPATIDQKRIEEVVASWDLSGARLLHVGVGDSSLALRIQGQCPSIDGITVSQSEVQRAESLGLPGYRVLVVNKFTREFAQRLRPGYRIIVDNNLASFACCAYHFASLLDNYRWALAPGGEILTDQRGMDWVLADRRWRMSFDDLVSAGRRFGLRASRVTDAVYALRHV